MSKILVIAPHPDDETLGCGGSLMRHKDEGDQIYWLIVTGISEDYGWEKDLVIKRDDEIKSVTKKYGFDGVFNLRLPVTKLDTLPVSRLVQKISDVQKEIEPEIIYLPFIYDVHTDHQVITK